MKSPELQQLTASEPLTLEQEYDMQRSWREDSDSEGSSVCKIFNIFNPPKCLCTTTVQPLLREKRFLLKISVFFYSRVYVHHPGQASVG